MDDSNNNASTPGLVMNPNQFDTNLSNGDKYFIEQRNIILQDVNNTMDSILNGLNELNISLENTIAVGKEFEVVTKLWKNFYNGTEPINDSIESDKIDKDQDMD